jgi:hypothetical protein
MVQRSLFVVGSLLKQALAIVPQRFLGAARISWVLYAPIDLVESALKEFLHGWFFSHRDAPSSTPQPRDLF